MEITWLGHSCFRLRGREGIVIIDPYDKSIGYGLGRQSADIVLVSHDHPGHNATAAINGSPRVVASPGEYEVKGVSIVGVQTAHDREGGRRRGKNTAWLIEMEDVDVCHLGDLGHTLTNEQAEAFGNVDVLLIPVGGHNTIDAAQASEVITLLEPKVVIPMHYQTDAYRGQSTLDPVEPFLREQGASGTAAQPRFSVSKSGLPEEAQVVLLEFRRT